MTAIEAPTPTIDAFEILDLVPSAVMVVAPDWTVRYANPEAARMLGAKGATLWDRCPDLEHTAFASGFRYAMSDRTELLSESALPAIGWCQARARPLVDGGLLILMRQVQPYTIEAGQARQALLVGEIGDALTREDSLHDALKRCTVAIVRNLDATLVRIWTAEEGDMLELAASTGLDQAIDLEQQTLRFGETKIGRIAEDLEPYLTNEVSTDPHVGGAPWQHRERIVSFAGYPLRVETRVVGVLAIYSRRLLDHDMLNALSTIADNIALGIARKTSDAARRRAEATLRAQAERMELLHQLGMQLAAELDVQALVQKVIDTATHLAGAEIGAFFYHLPGAGKDLETYYALAGARADAFATLPLPRTTPLLSHAFVGDKPIRIDDVHQHPSYGKLGPYFGIPPGHAQLAAYIGVPVRGRNGRRIGALMFGHTKPAAFTPETERLVTGIASTAAIAVDNARLFKEAHDLIDALEKSNSELDQFAYVASHDLKAPLRGIANLAQWIEDDLGDKMDDQAREHMHLLKGRVIRLENLIGGILAYSRAGRDTGDTMTVDVKQLVTEVWELLAAPPAAKLAITSDLPTLQTSRVQLQQIFLNLIGNAIKYNKDRDLLVEVSARREAGVWQFAVKDNGVGIAKDFHDKVWGLFQTLERRDLVESTGIGLSVVRKIVDARHGRTWLESALGEGATFFFTWPTAQGESLHG